MLYVHTELYDLQLKLHSINLWGNPHRDVANVLESDIVVSEFELQSGYYVQSWTNTRNKIMNPLYLPAMCSILTQVNFDTDCFGIK